MTTAKTETIRALNDQLRQDLSPSDGTALITTGLAALGDDVVAKTIAVYDDFCKVGPVGKGWRASIYCPGSTSALPDSLTNVESRKGEIVAQAKRIIDRRLTSRS